MCDNFTLVLKAHIALASQKFIDGTDGMSLDKIARSPMWNEGKDYKHGTGHGVGCFLNVHEGPQNIGMYSSSYPLRKNMILSVEPGYYQEGAYGIRIENLVRVAACEQPDFAKDFLEFKILTLCPVDKQLVNKYLMSSGEISWLNNYHKQVYERLSPFLNASEKNWLRMPALRCEFQHDAEKKMIKLLWAFMIMVALAIPLHAELTYEGAYNPNQNLQEYFDEAYPNYDKPIIYVFFNNDPCFQCPQTIELIEQVYNRNYQNEYSLFLINYQNDDEYNFIETYDLNQPLEVVLVDVADGQSIGYKKLENLQNQISDPVSFSENLQYQINSFFNEED